MERLIDTIIINNRAILIMKKAMLFIILITTNILFSQNVLASTVPFDLATAPLGNGSIIDSNGLVVSVGSVTGDVDSYFLDVAASENITFLFTLTDLVQATFAFGSAFYYFDTAKDGDLFTQYLTAEFSLIDVNTIDVIDPTGYTTTIFTPIPAVVWLFGSAILGFIGFTRRKLVVLSYTTKM